MTRVFPKNGGVGGNISIIMQRMKVPPIDGP